jgi:hypothetical protein
MPRSPWRVRFGPEGAFQAGMSNVATAEARAVSPVGPHDAALLAKLERDLECVHRVHMQLRDVPMTIREYVVAFGLLLELEK